MTKKHLEDCRLGKEFVNYALTHGAKEVRMGRGDHVVVKGENGQVVIPVGHELGKGLRSKVIKTLLLIGISAMIWLFFILPAIRSV